ncbi:MAG TPA: type II toxin-antitoxin system MqsA family antitoxin [Anaerolineales bacterium]
MKCLVCRQAELLRGFTSVTLERAETKLTITNVPALVCPSCGDACVDEDVAVRLLGSAERAVEMGMQGGVRKYGAMGD